MLKVCLYGWKCVRKVFYGNKIKKFFMKEKRKFMCRSDLNKVGLECDCGYLGMEVLFI